MLAAREFPPELPQWEAESGGAGGLWAPGLCSCQYPMCSCRTHVRGSLGVRKSRGSVSPFWRWWEPLRPSLCSVPGLGATLASCQGSSS